MSTDLDALLAELDGEGEKVTLFGEEWTLPVDVDAETMLRMERLMFRVALAYKHGKPIDPAEIIDDAVSLDDLVRKMAGEDNYREWMSRGLGVKKLQAIARTLYAIHTGGQQESGKGVSGGPAKPTKPRTGSGQSKSKRK